ncbi:LytR/AlgR family response regulator transcription factor [Flavobacterium urocaniciphilum]|uniref:Two component transcriptional regulator, LytTR family n=1 Tax=Flavobacterium urocaniciphilum TaxID=1299341 RepID=A0A1H8YVA3_9FLAO|nr:response regulator transcription factor [Flavobacterium urocaniciphilum]SEP55991.1 two component transcriptional regulator, LytTR family [Flavobacterium urocaniciphilum]
MENKTKILIVEDEILIANFIFKMLQKEGFVNLEVAYDVKDAEQKFKSFQPEIILLDINLDGLNTGIELAFKKNEAAKIIYLTAQNDPETIQKAINTNPETYLTKPIKKSDVLVAIQLASFKNTKSYTIIKDGYDEIKLFLDDIIYIKSDNIYIEIYTISKKYVLRKSLDGFLKEIDKDMFCKTHRSYIINKNRITKKTSNSVFLNDIEIPISRSFNVKI